MNARATGGVCDRCKQPHGGSTDGVMTAGYYEVWAGYWNQFANAGERTVCDACMWADPRYVAAHGPVKDIHNDE